MSWDQAPCKRYRRSDADRDRIASRLDWTLKDRVQKYLRYLDRCQIPLASPGRMSSRYGLEPQTACVVAYTEKLSSRADHVGCRSKHCQRKPRSSVELFHPWIVRYRSQRTRSIVKLYGLDLWCLVDARDGVCCCIRNRGHGADIGDRTGGLVNNELWRQGTHHRLIEPVQAEQVVCFGSWWR